MSLKLKLKIKAPKRPAEEHPASPQPKTAKTEEENNNKVLPKDTFPEKSDAPKGSFIEETKDTTESSSKIGKRHESKINIDDVFKALKKNKGDNRDKVPLQLEAEDQEEVHKSHKKERSHKSHKSEKKHKSHKSDRPHKSHKSDKKERSEKSDVNKENDSSKVDTQSSQPSSHKVDTQISQPSFNTLSSSKSEILERLKQKFALKSSEKSKKLNEVKPKYCKKPGTLKASLHKQMMRNPSYSSVASGMALKKKESSKSGSSSSGEETKKVEAAKTFPKREAAKISTSTNLKRDGYELSVKTLKSAKEIWTSKTTKTVEVITPKYFNSSRTANVDHGNSKRREILNKAYAGGVASPPVDINSNLKDTKSEQPKIEEKQSSSKSILKPKKAEDKRPSKVIKDDGVRMIPIDRSKIRDDHVRPIMREDKVFPHISRKDRFALRPTSRIGIQEAISLRNMARNNLNRGKNLRYKKAFKLLNLNDSDDSSDEKSKARKVVEERKPLKMIFNLKKIPFVAESTVKAKNSSSSNEGSDTSAASSDSETENKNLKRKLRKKSKKSAIEGLGTLTDSSSSDNEDEKIIRKKKPFRDDDDERVLRNKAVKPEVVNENRMSKSQIDKWVEMNVPEVDLSEHSDDEDEANRHENRYAVKPKYFANTATVY